MEKYTQQKNSELDLELIEKLEKIGTQNKYKEYLDVVNEELEKVRIEESGEPMFYLPQHLPKSIFLNPSKKDSKYQLFYLRKGIVDRLKYVQKTLPRGYHLWIANATRTEKIVKELYDIYIKRFQNEDPKLSHKEIDVKVRNILAMPDDSTPPGHMTGGAIDILLADKNGVRLPMKIDKNKVSNEVQSFTFYPNLPPEIKKNRKILYDTMVGVGFNNYFREFWHYSYGDAYWAVRRKKKVAIYGIPPKKLFEKKSL